MFSIVLLPELETVGNIGYWERVWQEETVYEIGWGVLPTFQGKGIASAATAAAVASARAEQKSRHIHAFPSVDNPASNAICRKLGFVHGRVQLRIPAWELYAVQRLEMGPYCCNIGWRTFRRTTYVIKNQHWGVNSFYEMNTKFESDLT